MEDIKIEDFLDYKNVSHAKYSAAIGNLDIAIDKALKNKEFKKVKDYLLLRSKISSLFSKRIAYCTKHGYDTNGKNR